MAASLSGDSEASIAAFFAKYESEVVNLGTVMQECEKFVRFHVEQNRRIILITSGGTTVPLEKNTVRFLDNFSTGSRGAAMTEAVLNDHADYAVVLLRRTGSLLPYAAPLTSINDGFGVLGSLRVDSDATDSTTPNACCIVGDYASTIARAARLFQQHVRSEQRLHSVAFTSVQTYLVLLRALTRLIDRLTPKRTSMAVLAAAVSDFYIDSPAEHKIQSGTAMRLELVNVPKMVGVLTRDWFANQCVVSFKLETDANVIEKKCQQSLQRDHQHMIVANLLQSRATRVTLIVRNELAKAIECNESTVIECTAQMQQLEPALVDRLIDVLEKFSKLKL